MIKTKSNFPFYSLLKNVLLIGVDYCAYVTSVVIAISVRKILPLLAPFLDFPVFSEAIYFVPEINIFMEQSLPKKAFLLGRDISLMEIHYCFSFDFLSLFIQF